MSGKFSMDEKRTKLKKTNVEENWSTGSDLLLIYTFIEFIYTLYWLDDFVQYVPAIKELCHRFVW